jgi:hypothetical protein
MNEGYDEEIVEEESGSVAEIIPPTTLPPTPIKINGKMEDIRPPEKPAVVCFVERRGKKEESRRGKEMTAGGEER